MNVKSFLMGLFRGASMNGELKQVEEAGRQDARMMGGAYLGGFRSELAKMFTEEQHRLIGMHGPEVVEAEYEVEPPALTRTDLKGMRKAELLELAETRNLGADESWTVAQLQEALTS